MFRHLNAFFAQVLADEGMAKSIAFDEIDKAPEEKQRGITIATVSSSSCILYSIICALIACLLEEAMF